MIDDFVQPSRSRRRPKRIEPLAAPVRTPLPQLVAAETAEQTVAAEASVQADQKSTSPAAGTQQAVPPRQASAKTRWYQLQRPFSKRQKIIAGVLVVLLFFGIGAGWTLTHHRREVTANGIPTKVKQAVKPAIIYSDLSGLPVASQAVNQRPVTAVMVENSIDARPQSGLSQAGIVFEAVAEGGVTRFMALYQDQTPTNVGPIRSARPYYVQWALGYDAGYAHVGGSTDALADITAWNVRDLNQFYNGNYYHRVTSREAPHNVYTGIDTLNQLEASKGYTSSSYTGFNRKGDQPHQANATNDPRVVASSIDFSLSGPTYDPHYDYNAAANSYNRSEAGAPQIDANTNAQLSPKVVVAIVVPETQGALDSSGAYYSDYNPIGSGQAYVFQDGTVATVTWTKASNTAPLTLTDASGKPVALNRGQTWITAVTDPSKVSYK